jgi:hypothetical protein
MSPDHVLVAVAFEGYIGLWDTDGRPVRAWTMDQRWHGAVRAMVAVPMGDCAYLATADGSGTLCMWDVHGTVVWRREVLGLGLFSEAD